MPVLLLIDFQRAFEDHAAWGGERSTPEAERRALDLLDAFRARGLPIVHVVHDSLLTDSPLRLDGPGGAPMAGFAPRPTELRIVKHENGAFAGTPLSTLLRRRGVDALVVGGLTLQHCVSTTVRTAANAGFDVTLASDAVAAFAIRTAEGRALDADTVRAVHLASLDGEFCRVRDVATIVGGLDPAPSNPDSNDSGPDIAHV